MTDNTARMIMICGFLLVVPFGIYHRLKVRTDERLDRRQEGWLILLTLRPLAFVAMVGLVAFMIEPAWMRWSSMNLPGWARWTGVPIGAAAGLLIIWTFRTLGHNLTDTVVTRRNATLITHGPYRWVRHPFYLAFALAVIANALVTANWFLAVTSGAAFASIVVRTSIEERHLIARFGSDYQAYMRRTGRFLPRLFRT
jgi:protein-S-isoprenylcysteine O-methyltransferase Ste14